jgi:hypothetical protein
MTSISKGSGALKTSRLAYSAGKHFPGPTPLRGISQHFTDLFW